MIKLKYSQPVIRRPGANEMPVPVMFSLHPQGEPAMTATTSERLVAMEYALRARLQPPITITCNPHRIGKSSCVSVHVEDSRGKCADILLMQKGHASFPMDHEFDLPRWHINVPDAADMVFLTIWINSLLSDS